MINLYIRISTSIACTNSTTPYDSLQDFACIVTITKHIVIIKILVQLAMGLRAAVQVP